MIALLYWNLLCRPSWPCTERFGYLRLLSAQIKIVHQPHPSTPFWILLPPLYLFSILPPFYIALILNPDLLWIHNPTALVFWLLVLLVYTVLLVKRLCSIPRFIITKTSMSLKTAVEDMLSSPTRDRTWQWENHGLWDEKCTLNVCDVLMYNVFKSFGFIYIFFYLDCGIIEKLLVTSTSSLSPLSQHLDGKTDCRGPIFVAGLVSRFQDVLRQWWYRTCISC